MSSVKIRSQRFKQITPFVEFSSVYYENTNDETNNTTFSYFIGVTKRKRSRLSLTLFFLCFVESSLFYTVAEIISILIQLLVPNTDSGLLWRMVEIEVYIRNYEWTPLLTRKSRLVNGRVAGTLTTGHSVKSPSIFTSRFTRTSRWRSSTTDTGLIRDEWVFSQPPVNLDSRSYVSYPVLIHE